MLRLPVFFCLLTLVCTTVVAQDKVKRDPLDWTYWRGPEQNGISRETGLPDTWNPKGGEGSNVAWKREDIGGRSTPVVMNGKLYTIVGERNPKDRDLFLQEKVVCLNAETGKTIWEVKNNVWNSDVPDVRVGWSSVVADPETGYVYAQGANGLFQCIDGEKGKVIWKIPMSERFGLLTTYGGRTNFPVLFEDLVIISGVVIGWGEQAKPNHRILGFDKKTGDVRWYVGTRNAPEDTTYSSPIIATFKGQRAVVLGCGDGGLWAFQPRTGKAIWQYDFSKRGLNTTPLVDGDVVYMGHSEENITGTNMGALAAVDATKTGNITKTGEIWKVELLGIGKAAPVLINGKLYAIDDAAKLYVVDAKTGEKIGPERGVGLGTISRPSVTYADGKLWLLEVNGRWAILPIKKDGTVEKPSRTNSGRLSGEELHASPVISHGKVYILSSECLYCLEDKDKKHGADPIPAPVDVEAPKMDDKPALVQVVPCEVLMQPGEKQKFTVNLFNAKGQFIKTSDAEFTLETKGGAEGQQAGEITKAGEFTAAPGKQHAVYLTAKVGELEGKARIRVVPPLPWAFDFEDKADLPITWIGMRYRHVLRKIGDNTVAVKVTTIPKGTRSRGWLGQSDLSNYTIQADVMSAESTEKKMADIGLSAQGYTLDLQGDQQKLQVRLWDSQLERFSKTIDFKWKPNVWYTMKLQASIVDDNAVLKAKVWPRDEKEPAKWTLEATDDLPVYEAAPGMFGNASNAEITLDNIKVFPNTK
jgi:outer membrane protein assembly factor BamB